MVIAPESLVELFLRATGANRSYLSAARAESMVRDRLRHPATFGVPRGLRRDIRIVVSRRHGWPVYRLTPSDAREGGGLGGSVVSGSVVYAHGGGWISEVATQHWQLAAQLAAECRTTVDLPIYPLIPSGSAAEVVATVVQLVLENRAELGGTVLAGDSAGGQIALSAALALRDQFGVTLPQTVLISPALDLTFHNPRIPAVQPSDPWLGVPGSRVFAGHWRGALDLRDPTVSPLFGDLAGLGPITLFTGTRDILNPDAELLRDKAAAAGVPFDFHEGGGQLHVYPLLPTRVGETARAEIVATVGSAVRTG